MANYASAFAHLQDRALHQARTRIEFRDKLSLHGSYGVHLHGTHVWVRRDEWNRLERMARLDLKQYRITSHVPTHPFTYAIPVREPIYLRVYITDVVTFRPNGEIRLHTGGWRTFTTMKWLNTAEWVNVQAVKPSKWDPSEWGLRDSNNTLTRFYDGLTLDAAGRIISGVQPFAKSRVDKARMRPFNAAVKQFRNHVRPYVQMLDGHSIPDAEAERLQLRRWPEQEITEHIISLPALDEIEWSMVAQMCIGNFGQWTRMRLYSVYPVDAVTAFENSLRRMRVQWTRDNALVSSNGIKRK